MKTTLHKLGMLMAVLLASLTVYAYDFEVDGIYYNVVSLPDLTCEVTKGDVEYSGDIEIPAEVKYNSRTLSVIAISGDCWDTNLRAFYKCVSLRSITMPNSIIKIGDYAFAGCSSLTAVSIPDLVTEVRDYTFLDCSSLTAVSIPDSVTEIGVSAFAGCSSLTCVTIPDSVTEIRSGAFSKCSSLTSITIPDSVTEIGSSAFSYCSSLTSVIIPESVTFIDPATFYGCSALTFIIIPNSVISIGNRAFYGCKSLSNIELGNSLEKIEYGVFEECENLESIEFPGSVKSIEWRHEDGFHSSPESYYIHTCYEFLGCNNLKVMKFLHGEESLGVYCLETNFNYWTSLPIEHFYIDRDLIWGSDEYTRRCIEGVKYLSIGSHIQEFTIGYKMSMSELTDLVSLKCYAMEPPKIGDFSNAQYLNMTVKVPHEALEAYQQADVWKNFWNLEGFDPNGTETDVDGIKHDVQKTEVGRYDLNGRRVSEDYDGISIIRYSDGSAKKQLIHKN